MIEETANGSEACKVLATACSPGCPQKMTPEKLAELADKLLLAMEEEKHQFDVRLQRAIKPTEKLKSA